jgi:histidyl-tRNA synthetase
VAERLRDGGLNVSMHHGGGSFKSQMKRADGSGARFAVIVGDDEAQADEATLKPLREQREQARVRVTDLMALIKG